MYLELAPLHIGETYLRVQCQCECFVVNFVSSDVILSTLFHSSTSVSTSCCLCIPHACVHFFSSMLLASVHHPDFMAHDVSASRNLESELPLEISPPGLFVLSIGSSPLSASCKPGWCAHSLLYKELQLTDADCECLLTLFAPGGDLGRQVLLAC